MVKQQTYVYENNSEYPEILNSFLKYICSKKKTEKTVKTYGESIKLFFRYIKVKKRWTKEKDMKKVDVSDFTEEQIKQITVNNIDDFILYCNDVLGNSAGTQNIKISALDTFYNYLMKKRRIVEVNPIDSIERPELDQKVVEYISVEKAIELLDVIRNSDGDYSFRNYCIVNLFLNTGMRLSELVGLNLDKIDFDNMTILVKGKGNKERVIDLNEDCINSIKEYLVLREELVNRKCVKKQDKDVLFISERGCRIATRTVQDIIKDAGKKISLDLHPHILRHTAATIMYQNGVELYTIKEILGHSNIQTTTRYAKVSNKQKKNAVNAIAEAMRR